MSLSLAALLYLSCVNSWSFATPVSTGTSSRTATQASVPAANGGAIIFETEGVRRDSAGNILSNLNTTGTRSNYYPDQDQDSPSTSSLYGGGSIPSQNSAAGSSYHHSGTLISSHPSSSSPAGQSYFNPVNIGSNNNPHVQGASQSPTYQNPNLAPSNEGSYHSQGNTGSPSSSGFNYGGVINIPHKYPSQNTGTSSLGSEYQFERPSNLYNSGDQSPTSGNYNQQAPTSSPIPVGYVPETPAVSPANSGSSQGHGSSYYENGNTSGNKYPILVSSSSNPHVERPANENSNIHAPSLPPAQLSTGPVYTGPQGTKPSYQVEKPAGGVHEGGHDDAEVSSSDNSGCVCVAASHCPLLSTRIVTPEETCERPDDVRCCLSDQNLPPARCGERTNITFPDVALRPGQARYGDYPWNVVLLTPDNEYVGGGVLLDSAHVLTAAHKVAAYTNDLRGLKVRMGEWDAAANHEPYPHLELPASYVYVHPDFNAKNLHSDVAVVRLAGRVDTRRYPHIAAACLPRQNALFTGHRCFVSGWGQDAFGTHGAYQRVLKHVDVPVVEADECEARLRDTKLSQYFHLDRHSFICAGGEPQKDACTGDGGSPLVCEDHEKGQFFVAGLVAWGIGCATHGIPGVYVNVASYSDWISTRSRTIL